MNYETKNLKFDIEEYLQELKLTKNVDTKQLLLINQIYHH